jgi:hypothetical protein
MRRRCGQADVRQPRSRAVVRAVARGAAPLVGVVLAIAGCGGRQVTLTARSGTEQQLLVRSLERAVAQLDTRQLVGRRVRLDLLAMTGDEAFAREFTRARLERRGVRVVRDASPPDVLLRVFATTLAVDRGETLLGIPALQVPIVSVPIPELPLFKWLRHRGLVEMQAYVYDPATDRLLDVLPTALGHAKVDGFTVLFVISFGVDDLDERAEPTAEQARRRDR